MPRPRLIYPELWEDEDFGGLSDKAQVLFLACLINADDDGRLIGNVAHLRSLAFRYKKITLNKTRQLRDEISRKLENLLIYQIEGKDYIQFMKWEKYQKQRPERRISSKLPPQNIKKMSECEQDMNKCEQNMNDDEQILIKNERNMNESEINVKQIRNECESNINTYEQNVGDISTKYKKNVSEMSAECQQNVSEMSAEVKLSKVKLSKVKLDEVKGEPVKIDNTKTEIVIKLLKKWGFGKTTLNWYMTNKDTAYLEQKIDNMKYFPEDKQTYGLLKHFIDEDIEPTELQKKDYESKKIIEGRKAREKCHQASDWGRNKEICTQDKEFCKGCSALKDKLTEKEEKAGEGSV